MTTPPPTDLHALSCKNCSAPLLEASLKGERMVCAYCGQVHAFRTPPAAAADPGESSYPPGAGVLVEWGGHWWEASIVSREAPALWRIHYKGWGDQWDESVGPERLAPGPGPTPAGPEETARGGATAGGWGIGAKVSAQWRGQWWDATVVGVEGSDRLRIHYEGWGDEWNEVVTPAGLRRRGTSRRGGRHWLMGGVGVLLLAIAVAAGAWWFLGGAPSPAQPPPGDTRQPATLVGLEPGTKVSVLWKQTWWQATVVSIEGPNAWRVHYEGWSEDWDEVVGPDRLRLP